MEALTLRRPSALRALLIPLVPFVAASLASPLYSKESIGRDWQWLRQAVVLWPFGAVLMVVPVLLVRQIINQRLRLIGLIGVALLAVVSAIAVARDEHSTEAFHYVYVLVGGPVFATLLLTVDYVRTNRALRRHATRPPNP